MKNFRLFRRKKGMTLIEAVVSVAILSVISIFIISVLTVASNMVSMNAYLKKSDKNAAAGIENVLAGFSADSNISVTNRKNGTFTVDFDGVTISPDGHYITGRDKDYNSEFIYFDPN